MAVAAGDAIARWLVMVDMIGGQNVCCGVKLGMLNWGKEPLTLAGMAPETRGAAAAPERVDELAPAMPAAGSEVVPGGGCMKDVGKIGNP